MAVVVLRAATKKLIHELLDYNPNVEKNIFKSAENVNLDKLLGYKLNGEVHSYIDEYDERKIIKE